MSLSNFCTAVSGMARLSLMRRTLTLQRATYATHAEKPPIALFGLDGTYASALYTAAVKSSALESTATSIRNLGQILTRDAKLGPILASPTLPKADRNLVITEMCKYIGSGSSASSAASSGNLISSFLHTLADNRRLYLLNSICQKFGLLMSSSRGEVDLIITSASPLEAKTLKQLELAISKSQLVEPSQRIRVIPKVNPEIKGGLILECGNRTIDLSVSLKLAKLNNTLRESL